MKKHDQLIYALKDGQIVSIADVDSGLSCNCVCPACSEKLIAKKGKKRAHHFSHMSGNTCEYGYETSLHLAAKDILSRAQTFVIPPVFVSFPNSSKGKEHIYDSKEITIDSVELEKRINSIIPDIVVSSGGKKLIIEIYVSHAIDEYKLEKIKSLDISTIEIDLSRIKSDISIEQLSEILIKDSSFKNWKYNSLSRKYYEMYKSVSHIYDIVFRNYALHVDYCPIKARVWRGKPYANYIDDCQGCKYHIESNTDIIYCSGKNKIATKDDLWQFKKKAEF